MTTRPDDRSLAALVDFARVEARSGDIEPWAGMLVELRRREAVTLDQAFWLTKLYNAYDSFHSAWGVFRRWPTPQAWWGAGDAGDAATFECTRERRNLRGGRVLRHLDSYLVNLAGQTQEAWISQPLMRDDPGADFDRLTAWVRCVWGVGRQTAFEWAEFAGKVCGLPVAARDAQLWESEGPRRSLQRLYGNPNPDRRWLADRAEECKQMLAEQGVHLSWEDFETVICDFNVMRDGRYYPGRHLAALREEINGCPEDDRAMLLDVFGSVALGSWADIEPGINKQLLPLFRDTGRMVTEPR